MTNDLADHIERFASNGIELAFKPGKFGVILHASRTRDGRAKEFQRLVRWSELDTFLRSDRLTVELDFVFTGMMC